MLVYATTFDKQGPGYLKVSLAEVEEEWVPEAIHFALPTSDPDTRRRMREIQRRFMAVMAESIESPE